MVRGVNACVVVVRARGVYRGGALLCPLLRLTQRVLRGGHGLLAGVQVPVLALRNRRAACNKNDVFQHRLVGVCSMQSVLYNLVGFFYLIFNK